MYVVYIEGDLSEAEVRALAPRRASVSLSRDGDVRVGRIRWREGVRDLIEALAPLRERIRHVAVMHGAVCVSARAGGMARLADHLAAETDSDSGSCASSTDCESSEEEGGPV